MVNKSIESISKAYKSMYATEEMTQESLPNRVYVDDNASEWSIDTSVRSMISKESGYSESDIVGITINDMVLLKLNRSDRSFVSGIRLKDGEFIARYVTNNSAAGGIMPFIKVSLPRLMIYPLVEESSSGETDEIRFESRGTKVRYIRVLKDFLIGDLSIT